MQNHFAHIDVKKVQYFQTYTGTTLIAHFLAHAHVEPMVPGYSPYWALNNKFVNVQIFMDLTLYHVLHTLGVNPGAEAGDSCLLYF